MAITWNNTNANLSIPRKDNSPHRSSIDKYSNTQRQFSQKQKQKSKSIQNQCRNHLRWPACNRMTPQFKPARKGFRAPLRTETRPEFTHPTRSVKQQHACNLQNEPRCLVARADRKNHARQCASVLGSVDKHRLHSNLGQANAQRNKEYNLTWLTGKNKYTKQWCTQAQKNQRKTAFYAATRNLCESRNHCGKMLLKSTCQTYQTNNRLATKQHRCSTNL